METFQTQQNQKPSSSILGSWFPFNLISLQIDLHQFRINTWRCCKMQPRNFEKKIKTWQFVSEKYSQSFKGNFNLKLPKIMTLFIFCIQYQVEKNCFGCILHLRHLVVRLFSSTKLNTVGPRNSGKFGHSEFFRYCGVFRYFAGSIVKKWRFGYSNIVH